MSLRPRSSHSTGRPSLGTALAILCVLAACGGPEATADANAISGAPTGPGTTGAPHGTEPGGSSGGAGTDAAPFTPGPGPASTPAATDPTTGGTPTPTAQTPTANGGASPTTPGTAGSPGSVPTPSGPTGAGGTPPGSAAGGNDNQGPSAGAPPDVPVDVPVVVDRPPLVTSAPGSYWQVGEWTEAGGGNPMVSVDENTTHQEWLGFGGTFNEAGWDVLLLLDAAERDRAVKLLFDATEGANLAWGRFPMGASDYALDRYSLNDTPNDFAMASFSIDRDRELLIPYIKAGLAAKPNLRLWASPWSPPAWMKTSQDMNGGRLTDSPEMLAAYALYFALFVEQYAAEGLDVEMVMPQNEPGYETRYPSCLWTPELLRDFVRDYLGPTFAERDIGAEIWFGTMSAPEDTEHMDVVMADANAAPFVKGFGLQWNTMGSTGGLWSRHQLPVMQTEHKCGNYPWEMETFNPDRPPNDDAYARESWGLIRDWIGAGVHSYSAWNMVLDTQGQNLDVERPWPQNALLTVDRQSRTLTVTPAYYVFRHLSYFVDPGAVRLGTSGSADALAFRNPNGSIVTVIHNGGGQSSQVTLGVGGRTVQFEVPAQGWATVNVE